MAHCFACDIPTEKGYDKKTDRFYCQECFEPTNQVLLHQLESELERLFGPLEEFETEEYVEEDITIDDEDPF